jgi:hypothetical protein
MIVGKHGEDPFAHKEGRLAVGEFFGGLRQRETDSPDSLQMFFARARLWDAGFSLSLLSSQPWPSWPFA